MTLRVNNTWSNPLPVYGGVPQGSILGVMLFNISTDDLEDQDTDPRRLTYSTESEDSTGDGDPLSPSGESGLNPRAAAFIPAWGDPGAESHTDPELLVSTSSSDSSATARDRRLDPGAAAFVPVAQPGMVSDGSSAGTTSAATTLDPGAAVFQPYGTEGMGIGAARSGLGLGVLGPTGRGLDPEAEEFLPATTTRGLNPRAAIFTPAQESCMGESAPKNKHHG